MGGVGGVGIETGRGKRGVARLDVLCVCVSGGGGRERGCMCTRACVWMRGRGRDRMRYALLN